MRQYRNKEEIETTEEFHCECGAHIMQVTDYISLYDEDSRYSRSLWIAMFDHGGRPSLWWRIKTAWRLVFHGTMHRDHVTLDDEERKRLVEFINTDINERIKESDQNDTK